MARAWGILLGGGRSARMGHDKLALTRDGQTLAALGVTALLGAAEHVVVSSPERSELVSHRVSFALEDPPFGGPVAGIAAALDVLAEADAGDDLYLLAGDLASPERVVATLAGAPRGVDGTVLLDPEGWPQYLAGRYRLGSLRSVLGGEVRDSSVRSVFRALDLASVQVAESVTADVDTPAQARVAGLL